VVFPMDIGAYKQDGIDDKWYAADVEFLLLMVVTVR
jgi:hypothetical protein